MKSLEYIWVVVDCVDRGLRTVTRCARHGVLRGKRFKSLKDKHDRKRKPSSVCQRADKTAEHL